MSNLQKICRTRFLFPPNSFLIGAGCAFNIVGNYYGSEYLKRSPDTDAKAIENDWRVIGQDLYEAIGKCAPNKISPFTKPQKLKESNYVKRILSSFFKLKRSKQAGFAARA